MNSRLQTSLDIAGVEVLLVLGATELVDFVLGMGASLL